MTKEVFGHAHTEFYFSFRCFEIILRAFLDQNSGQMADVCSGMIIHSVAQVLLPKLTRAAPLARTGFGFPRNHLKMGNDGAYQEYLEQTRL